MTKAEIYKQAKRLIECGKPKQEVFEEMSFVGVKTPKKLAQMIRRISSFENRKKFVFYQVLLLVFVLASIAVQGRLLQYANFQRDKFDSIIALASLILSILLFIGIMRFHFWSYAIIGYLGTFWCLYMLTLSLFNGFRFFETAAIIYFFCRSILAFYLQQNIFPTYITEKRIVTNTQGRNFVQRTYRFYKM
jgi:hypothetical protein